MEVLAGVLWGSGGGVWCFQTEMKSLYRTQELAFTSARGHFKHNSYISLALCYDDLLLSFCEEGSDY